MNGSTPNLGHRLTSIKGSIVENKHEVEQATNKIPYLNNDLMPPMPIILSDA